MVTKTLKARRLLEQCPQVRSIDGVKWLCRTCKSHISKGKIPPMSVLNRMTFPPSGMFRNLNQLEATLLSVRLPFMRIYKAPRGNQRYIRGNMVLVPANVTSTVTQLPRLTSNIQTIKATLKRRLRYKHHVYCLNIRPELVREGAKLLSGTNLFKDHITVNDQWQQELVDNSSELLDSDEEESEAVDHEVSEVEQEQRKNSESDSDWSEFGDDDENERHMQSADTMLSAPDFVEDNERKDVYNFAPGEGNIPVSVCLEPDIEELAFPAIFCGQRRPTEKERPVRVTYSEIVKSELRNADNRAAMSIDNIFFKTKKLQMKTMIDTTQIAVRKVKRKNRNIMAKDVKGKATDDLIHKDKAYKCLSNVRGSPPYFEKYSKDLFAMIRQLGGATFFVTLSAAETRWSHLLKILGQVSNGRDYLDDEISQLTWDEKCQLIGKDPVTCARHFDYSYQKLMSTFVLSALHPLGEVTDYSGRTEYQNRKSPHVHMLLWCRNAPKYGESSIEEISEFVDKFISCNAIDTSEDEELANLTQLQRHRHSHTCRMKKEKRCRFGFPKPPMLSTTLLEPLTEADFTTTQVNDAKKTWKKIYVQLNELDENSELTFEELLQILGLSEEDYILAIRSSIKRTTVFLKRSTAETRMNNYNSPLLSAWRANVDIQYVTDVYACATYVASYITKSQRGMSDLLRTATKEAREGNNTLKDQMRCVGNKFLNAVEIGAQEAIYICLGLPMRRSSRQTVFVNTSPPEERVSLLKPAAIIDAMDDDDQNVECSGLITRYAERPTSMKGITLAEFAAFYDKKKSMKRSFPAKKSMDGLLPEANIQEEEDRDDDDEDDDGDDEERAESKGDKSEYKRRNKAKILRRVYFNPDSDFEKYYRELIMMYHPWTDEDKLIGGSSTFYERFQVLETKIVEEQTKFEPFFTAVDQAQRVVQNADLEDEWNELAPLSEHSQARDEVLSEDQPDAGIEDYDIGADMGITVSNAQEEILKYHELPDDDYRQLMRLLTQTQRDFVYDTIHSIKTSSSPLYRFLSGGAGVGKSFVTKALYQTALKYLNKQEGEDFDTRRLLLVAPTGKAAYHIHGNTIHSALRISANQKLQHKPLSCSSLNSLRNKIGSIRLMFIDEISMVGRKMFQCIHQRLVEMTNNPAPFGGVSIIAVGDLFQLKPVMDSYIFTTSNSDYSSLATSLWRNHLKKFELKEIMRQADCRPFAELLNRLREGNHTEDDIQVLKQCALNPNDINYPEYATHLFATNKKVNAYNQQIILKSTKPVYSIKAKDRVIGSGSPTLRLKILDSFKKNTKLTNQLSTELIVSEGLHYDITVNLDTTDGLINGASCQIIKIDIKERESVASGLIWVEFEDAIVGSNLRKESKRMYKPGYKKEWTTLQPAAKQFAAGYKGQAQVQRFQYALRPSHAKTIHRSQGDTMKTAVIDLTTSRKVEHLHYVAISRLQSIDGLKILNLQENKISVHRKVVDEMQRLRAEPLQLKLNSLISNNNQFIITFLNARSLHRHINDVIKDYNISAANIALFCETRFDDTDDYDYTSIENFYQYRQDNPKKSGQNRSPYGLVLYSKDFLWNQTLVDESQNDLEIMRLEILNLSIIYVYKPQRVSSKELCKVLQNIFPPTTKRLSLLVISTSIGMFHLQTKLI